MRIKEIDTARGFTVLIMPAVHVLMINSTFTTQTSFLGKFFGFLAEGPGAQLFMLLMGMSFSFSKNKSFTDVLKKAFILLIAGYTLNFLKFDLPILAGIMPQSFLTELHLKLNANGMIQLFLIGDILQLAAIAMVILGIVYQLPKFHVWALMIATLIILISPVQLINISDNLFTRHLTDLLFAQDEYVYFPVFPWLCYPLIGLSLGHYLFTTNNFFTICRNAGIALMIAGKLFCFFGLTGSCDNFYKTGAGGTMYHLGFVLLWLYLIHLVVVYLPPNRFCNFLLWLSRNITGIYIIQWICIFWMINVGGYHQLGITASIVYILFMSSFVFGLNYCINRLLRK